MNDTLVVGYMLWGSGCGLRTDVHEPVLCDVTNRVINVAGRCEIYGRLSIYSERSSLLILARLLSGSTVLRNAIDGGYIAPFGRTSPWPVSTAYIGIWLVLATLVSTLGVLQSICCNLSCPTIYSHFRRRLWCHLGLHLSGCAPCCAMRRDSSSMTGNTLSLCTSSLFPSWPSCSHRCWLERDVSALRTKQSMHIAKHMPVLTQIKCDVRS